MKTVAIVQARMGSTRLPRKVMLEIAGKPMIVRVIERVEQARSVDETVVATTRNPADEAIVKLCEFNGWKYFRGNEQDVLDRYYHAAKAYHAETIIRVTSDCPLIDPDVVDLVARHFLESKKTDYASNTLPPRTFPRGLDTEVLTFQALERAWLEDTNALWREHVTPYIYRHPEVFSILGVTNETDYSHYRWTVDTIEDLTVIQHIYHHFKERDFSWLDVLNLLQLHPEWYEINRNVQQKVLPWEIGERDQTT